MLRSEIDKLTTNWRSILTDIIDKMPELEKEYEMNMKKYTEILPSYPCRENIFRCFNYFNIEDTRVVILGQDPYHGEGQAIGLSFGVNEGEKQPPSLKNIFKNLENPKTTTTLEHWAKQGVLMLNAALTVRHKTPASYMKMWLPFTTKIIEYVNNKMSGIIFVAWGAFAHKILENTSNNNELIVCSHPSPLSYSRKYKHYPSFKESNCFNIINSKLETVIEW